MSSPDVRAAIFEQSKTMTVSEIAKARGMRRDQVRWDLWKYRKDHGLPVKTVAEVVRMGARASARSIHARDLEIAEMCQTRPVPTVAGHFHITQTRVLAALARVQAARELPDEPDDEEEPEGAGGASLGAVGAGCEVCGLRGEHVCTRAKRYEERRRAVMW